MRFIFGLIGLVVMGCANNSKKEVSSFLQQEEIQIVQPKLLISNRIIDSVETIDIAKGLEDAQIFYTIDKSEPTEQSLAFTIPIQVKKEGVYKFKSFLKGWKPSETIAIEFFKKGMPIEKIKWITTYDNKYSGQGENTLINASKATSNFGNKEWLGFDTIAVAAFNFEKKKFVKTLKIGYLNDPSSWIFPPKEVTLFTSYDGVTFDKINVKLEALPQSNSAKMEQLIIEINKEFQFAKIEVQNVDKIPEWHEGKGKKAWLFMDEWLFN